jgi:hypothetical protein
MERAAHKAAAYVIAIFGVIAFYLAGMTMTLFGPSSGRLLGMPAFLATVMILAILSSKQKRGTLRCLAEFHHSICRFRRLVWAAMILLVLVIVPTFVAGFAASAGAGVADTTRPIFAQRPEYQLCNHGVYTTVTRARYLVEGASFVIGWHTFGMLFALSGLHLALFGQWPPLLGPNSRRS